jgi:hypothetical protein
MVLQKRIWQQCRNNPLAFIFLLAALASSVCTTVPYPPTEIERELNEEQNTTAKHHIAIDTSDYDELRVRQREGKSSSFFR